MPDGAGVLAQVEIEPVTCCTHVTIRSQVTLENKCHLPLEVLTLPFSTPSLLKLVGQTANARRCVCV